MAKLIVVMAVLLYGTAVQAVPVTICGGHGVQVCVPVDIKNQPPKPYSRDPSGNPKFVDWDPGLSEGHGHRESAPQCFTTCTDLGGGMQTCTTTCG